MNEKGPATSTEGEDAGAVAQEDRTERAVESAERAVESAEQAVESVSQSVTQALPEPAAQAVESASQTIGSARDAAERETLPPTVALLRGRNGLIVAVVGLGGFFAIFALVRARRTEALDTAITVRLQRFRHPAFARLMEGVSWPGFPPQSRIVPPLVMGSLWFARLRLEAGFQLLAWGTGLVSTVVKAFMKRQRPVAGTDLRVVVARLGGSSFPSGHVITYVGTYGFMGYLAYTLIRPAGVRRAVTGGLLGLVTLVGPSRIYQGHHWATDVSASYLLGTSYLIGVTGLYRRLKARQAARRRARGTQSA